LQDITNSLQKDKACPTGTGHERKDAETGDSESMLFAFVDFDRIFTMN
jgi:hypothetical protein